MQFPCQAWPQYCDTVNADSFQCCEKHVPHKQIWSIPQLINTVLTLYFNLRLTSKHAPVQTSLKTFLLPHEPLVCVFKNPVHEGPNPSLFTWKLSNSHLQVLQRQQVFQTEALLSRSLNILNAIKCLKSTAVNSRHLQTQWATNSRNSCLQCL